MPHSKNKQEKNTNPIISREDYHIKQLEYQREKNKKTSPPPIRKTAQVTPNRMPTQTIGPTLPSKGRNQKEEGIDIEAWEKKISNRIS